MALVTTFATTPLTSALYPPWYQKKLAAWKRGEIDWDGNHLLPDSTSSEQGDASLEKYHGHEIRKLLVYLRLDSLPSLFTFVALLGGDRSGASITKLHPQKVKEASKVDPTADNLSLRKSPLEVHGIHMLDLSERQSSVMKESEVDDYSSRDPVVNAFHSFGQLNNVAVSGEVQLVPEGSYAEILNGVASNHGSDLVLIPWSETGRLAEAVNPLLLDPAQNSFTSGPQNHFVTSFLADTPCNAAIFVNNSFGALPRKEQTPLKRVATTLSLRSTTGIPTAPIVDRSHHIFFPFFGGADDRVALRFVLRLAQNSNVTATIININTTISNIPESSLASPAPDPSTSISSSQPDPYSKPSYDQDRAFFTAMKDSLPHELEPRVLFSTLDTEHPLRDVLELANAEVGLSPRNAGDIVVVGRGPSSNVVGDARRSVKRELEALRAGAGVEMGVERSLGVVADGVIGGNVRASVLVIQAGKRGKEE